MSYDGDSSTSAALFHKQVYGPLLSAFKSEQYSDLVIRCGPKTWKVHKVVVCGGSEYFRKAFSSEFLESSSNEITLKDEEPEVVRAILLHLYTGSYGKRMKHDYWATASSSNATHRVTGDSPPDTPQDLMTHVKVYIAADKYLLPALKTLALEKIKDTLAKPCSEKILLDAAQLTFDNTRNNDQHLRDPIITAMRERIHDILLEPGCEDVLGAIGMYLARDMVKEGAPPCTPISLRSESQTHDRGGYRGRGESRGRGYRGRGDCWGRGDLRGRARGGYRGRGGYMIADLVDDSDSTA